MADQVDQKTRFSIKTWAKGIKTEFSKIIFPDRDALIKQTSAVVIVTACLAVIVAVLDAVIKWGLALLI
jgi:preprotein translocase subunit SecE